MLAVFAAGVAGVAVAATTAFDIGVHGNFRRMMHTGDSSAKVALAELPQSPGTWGVGALAALKGEVLLHDGRLRVSRGDDERGRTVAAAAGDAATLMVTARVSQWHDVPVPADLDQPKFEAFVREQAARLGLDLAQPFPFRVEGRFPLMTWHVVTGAGGGHGGHANKSSGLRVFEQPGADGLLVGFYSGEALEGVISHPGERFHVHYADGGLTVSGHVDAYAVAQGAVLKLPRR